MNNIRTLIIEDNKTDLLLALRAVKKAGIENPGIARHLGEIQNMPIEQRKYDLIISDTIYGRNILFGPPAVELLRGHGKPVVIAVSTNASYEKYWRKGSYDYFFTKADFCSDGSLQKILKLEFGLTPLH